MKVKIISVNLIFFNACLAVVNFQGVTMSHTLQQHHFNAIIYYASEAFAMEMLHNAANRNYRELQTEEESQILLEDLTHVLRERKAISPDTRYNGQELVEQNHRTLMMANNYRLNIDKDLHEAQTQLKSYLNNYADEKFRGVIYKLITDIKQGIPTVQYDHHPAHINHNALGVFVQQLASDINNTFSHTYKYQEPTSSHFLILFLAHPIVRGLNSLSFLAGIAALTVGILAVTGMVTGLPATTASILIAGGAGAGISGVSLIACSFFRHRSPEELAERCEKLSLPEMEPIQLPTLNSANDSMNTQTSDEEISENKSLENIGVVTVS